MSVRLVVSLSALFVCGCWDMTDCKLYNTCAGDLIKLAVVDLPDAGAEDCRACLQRYCKEQADECSVDIKCNFVARCRLQSTPSEYQDCLLNLYEHGYTKGDEDRKPWEGPDDDNDSFTRCRHREPCASRCDQARFTCDTRMGEYNIEVLLAVRKYSTPSPGQLIFDIANDAQVRTCVDDDACAEWHDTDENGLVTLQIPRSLPPALLYFQIKPKDDARPDFPLTLFYPRRLGDSGLQLVSAYVIRSETIANRNGLLGFEPAVLTNAAQSVILPDGCIWEVQSAPGMKVTVENRTVPQCYAPEASCDGTCDKPCIWYATGTFPSRTTSRTDGTGAGIIGLSAGRYVVRAEDEDGNVSRRTILMVNGGMTIARTWPELR